MPGSRVMMTAFSVEPKPSHTVQSNRRWNSSISRSLASLPNAMRSGLSCVVGLFGRGQNVGERLADIVHIGGAVAADVVEEVRRRELRRRHRRAVGHRHAPARYQRVGVEQRHRQVAGVVLGDLELLDEGLAGHQHHEMRHPHGFRVAARPGGEDQHVGVHRLDLAVRRQLTGGLDHPRPVVGRGVQDLHTVEVEAVEQRPMFGVGHHDLAVGPSDVGGQRLAPASGVDPAEHVAAEGGRRHLVQEFRGVTHQHADVQRPIVVGQRQQRGGAGRRVAQVLTPRPATPRRTSPRRCPTSRARAAIAGWSRSPCW